MGGDNFGVNHHRSLCLVLCTLSVVWVTDHRQRTKYKEQNTLGTFLNNLLDRLAQLSGVHASEMLVNNLALLVVEKRRGQIASPLWIYKIDRRFRIRRIEQVGRHRRLHRVEKLRHLGLDVSHVVKRHSYKIQLARPIFLINLHEIRKLVATRITERRPKIDQQRMLPLLSQQILERVSVDWRDYCGRFAWLRGAAFSFLGRRRETQQHHEQYNWNYRFRKTHFLTPV